MEIEATIVPGSTKYEEDHPGWRRQVAAFRADLGSEVGGVDVRATPQPGSRGTVEVVVLALTSPILVSSAVACFKAWLARDKTRSLDVTWTDEAGTERRISVSGDSIDRQSFQELMRSWGPGEHR